MEISEDWGEGVRQGKVKYIDTHTHSLTGPFPELPAHGDQPSTSGPVTARTLGPTGAVLPETIHPAEESLRAF